MERHKIHETTDFAPILYLLFRRFISCSVPLPLPSPSLPWLPNKGRGRQYTRKSRKSSRKAGPVRIAGAVEKSPLRLGRSIPPEPTPLSNSCRRQKASVTSPNSSSRLLPGRSRAAGRDISSSAGAQPWSAEAAAAAAARRMRVAAARCERQCSMVT